MKKMLLCAAAGAMSLTLSMSQAAADTSFSKDELVDHLIGTIDLGAARAICIGTAEECAPEVPPALDMMVNFEFDSYDLTPETRENLRVFADALNDPRLEIADFLVEGHTDAVGSDQYNLVLSERRAAAVTEYLIDLGVEAERLKAIGHGSATPRVDDPMDPINRRVEMRGTLH